MPVFQSRFVEQTVLSSPEGRALPRSEIQRESIFGEAQDITSGKIEAGFNHEVTTLAPQIKGATSRVATIGGAMALLVALGAAAFALSRIRFEFRARARVEGGHADTDGGVDGRDPDHARHRPVMVNPAEFQFGMSWLPQMAMRADHGGSSGEFGSVPLYWKLPSSARSSR